MRDRRLELGSSRALAAELGMPAGSLRRLIVRGPPPSWPQARLEAFAQQLVFVVAQAEAERRRNPAKQAIVERRRQQATVIYTDAARAAALAPIRDALEEYEARSACAFGSWTPRAELAREMGVSSGRIGRWLEAGRVPAAMMPLVSEWAMRRAEQQLQRFARMGLVEELIARAKRPALAHGLPGAPKAQAARAPDLKNHEGVFQSADNVGYQWVRRVEEFSTFERISKLEKWALARRIPPTAKIGRANLWIVTAICTIYDPPDSLAAKDERRQRRRRSKSPGAFRQFERKVDKNQIGRDLMLGAAVSSRTVRRGGLERAVRLWLENMLIEHCENELVFIHGLIIRNWRTRGDRERDIYVKREFEKWERTHRAEERKRERERKRVRERARREALGRHRGNRAAMARPSRKQRT